MPSTVYNAIYRANTSGTFEEVANNSNVGGGSSSLVNNYNYEVSPSEHAYSIDDKIYYNEKFYTVTAAISIGDTIVTTGDNANVSEDTTEEGQLLSVTGIPNEGGGGSDVDLSKTIATIESTSTASRNYVIGEKFIDSQRYLGVALTSISSGETLILDTNYQRKNIGTEFRDGILIGTIAHGTGITYETMLNSVYSLILPLSAYQKTKLRLKKANTWFHFVHRGSDIVSFSDQTIGTNNELRNFFMTCQASGSKYVEYTIATNGTVTYTDNSSNTSASDLEIYL